MFYFNYIRLCNKKGISPSAAAEAMGYQRSVVTRWSNGCNPRDATLQRIADYFGVPVEELTKENPPQPVTAEEDERNTGAIADFIRTASESELADLNQYIEFIKSKRK